MAPRNLFRVRTAEYLDDYAFLKLFGAEALDIFNADKVWAQMQIIRSSRGGGKTSLLRIFSPRSLNQIKNQATSLKPLVDKLVELGVLSDTHEINMLGVSLSLFGNYSLLEHLGFERPRQQRLFFALLASKIVISALRSVCELKKAKFPDDLIRIRIDRPPDPNIRECVPVPCDGQRLYEWAAEIENRVYAIIEQQSDSDKDLGGYETLSLIHLIQSSNLSYDGKRVAEKTLLMLDDAHCLTPTQRKHLARALTNLRVPLIWVAERLEALNPEDMLSPDGTDGREWGPSLIVEQFWRHKRRRSKFVSFLKAISNKRASSGDSDVDFSGMLTDALTQHERFEEAIEQESKRITRAFGTNPQYKEWFSNCQNCSGSQSERAMQWRLLEINIERLKHHKQQLLFPNDPLAVGLQTTSPSTRHVANFYIRKKYNIPHYYGFDSLARLSSSNVQQFLYLAGGLFDQITNARIAGRPVELSPKKQDEILTQAAARRWDDIIRIIDDQALENFVDNMADFCTKETDLPNAPYDSVTGIAISTENLRLLQNLPPNGHSQHRRLASILSTCFAHNILEPRPYAKQGSPGTTHLVMYLNRLFCIRYKLPLAYGGWREKSLSDLLVFSQTRSSRIPLLDHVQSELGASSA